MNRVIRILCIATLLYSASGCTPSQVVQETSKTADQTVFDQSQTATQAWDSMAAPDLKLPDVQAYVARVADRLAKHAKMPDSYHVRVTDDPQVNGASWVGGEIIITRGMLNACINEAELAGYIGHEIGHQDLGHSATPPSTKSLWGRLVDEGMRYVPDSTGAVAETQRQANDIQRARFSQQKEQDADDYGALLAGKAGYDPYALADLFDRLAGKINSNAFYRLAKLKGSHKALDARAAHLREFLKKQHQVKRGEIGALAYRTGLESLVAYEGAGSIPPATAKQLDAIRAALNRAAASGQRLPPAQFVKVMRQLSEAWRGARPPAKTSARRRPSVPAVFMEESILMPLADWAGGMDALQADVDGLIKLAGHVALGLVAPEALAVVGLYETISGRDFILDQPLSPTERMLAAVPAMLAAGSAVAALVAYSGEAAVAAEEAGLSAASAAEARAAVSAAGQVAGAVGEDSVVIGESMASRVGPAAEELGAGIYDPPAGIPEAEWKAANQAWIQQQIDEGKNIYDIGVGPDRARSPYYNLERQALSDAGYQRQYVKDVAFKDASGRNYIVKLFQWTKS